MPTSDLLTQLDLKARAMAVIEDAGSTPSGYEILYECIEVAEMLVRKNREYGDSALNPNRIFSRADPVEQIKVRMDDKLNRLMQGTGGKEDAVGDLLGYIMLLRVAERRLRRQRAVEQNQQLEDLAESNEKSTAKPIVKQAPAEGLPASHVTPEKSITPCQECSKPVEGVDEAVCVMLATHDVSTRKKGVIQR